VSGVTQTDTTGYNSHPSSSGPTLSSIQLNFRASNSLPTNSKNEDLNPYHDPFHLSLGKRALHGTTNKIKHSTVLQKGRDSIESMPYIGSGLREPNTNDCIFSSLRCNHPQNHVCSIRSSPIHFRSIRSSPIHFHRSVDMMKRNICHTPSMKTAISHSKLIKMKEFTEKRVLNGVVRFGRVS